MRDVYLKVYFGSIPPCGGERHWPRIEYPLDPPPIKISLGRPRKNRIKGLFEDPKRPGKLTKHGMEMTCSLCKTKGDNKRRCPQRDVTEASQPPVKKAKGRPRNDMQEPQASIHTDGAHLIATSQPTMLGRGGRTIRGGLGSRGRSTRGGNTSRGGTRGGSTAKGGRGTGRRGTATRGTWVGRLTM